MYADPKAGYRAYHFLVAYEKDGTIFPIEVQVKTKNVKELSDLAHTIYKTGNMNPKNFDYLNTLALQSDMGNQKSQDKLNRLMSNPKKAKAFITKGGKKYNLGGLAGIYDVEEKDDDLGMSKQEYVERFIPNHLDKYSERLKYDLDTLFERVRGFEEQEDYIPDLRKAKAYTHYYNNNSHFYGVEDNDYNDSIRGFLVLGDKDEDAKEETIQKAFLDEDYGDSLINWKLDYDWQPQSR